MLMFRYTSLSIFTFQLVAPIGIEPMTFAV